MATITTDTFLDGGTARTAGETWTCNGGRLTVRTDTRWHANAPASMTGSIGGVTISPSLGGGYTIDGTKVRWMPYNTGTGNVPAIGTTVSQGGVSGYLLGVWASVTAVPTAVAAAMPASGFIKFREVTGGAFAAGALTGIGASATGPDVVGWIEVVHDQAVGISVPRLGDFTTRGDWFDLGTTTGAANQIVQLPTNGSATCYVPGLWIEDAVGSGVYEYYPSVYVAAMITTNMSTDARSKFVTMETNGSCRIGHNGTGAVGYVPAAGCKIRVPNIFGRHATTAARATNVIPSQTANTRTTWTTTSAGSIDIEHFLCDWNFTFAQPYSVKLNHVGVFDWIVISECATALDLLDGGNGVSATSSSSKPFALTSCFAGGTVTDWYSLRHAATAGLCGIETLYCSGQTFTRCKTGILTFARNATGYAYTLIQSTGITMTNCYQYNHGTLITTCSDILITGLDHMDRYVGTTNSTTSIYAVNVVSTSRNVVVDDLRFGLNFSIANCNPYLGIFSATASSDIVFKNMGIRTSMVAGGTNAPARIFVSGGNNNNVAVKRCYVQPTRTGALLTLNSDRNNVYEHVYGDFADAMDLNGLNEVARSCAGTYGTTGLASVYGTHYWHAFTSDTAGRVVLAFNEPTAETASLVTYVAGTPQFTSAGNLVLNNVGDEVIIESSYFMKGITALNNTAPTVTGTNVTYSANARWGNHDIYYQIDTGTGYGGTWKNFTAANLSGETVTAATGFKIKMRFVCATASTTNLLTFIGILTTSTLAAQQNYYPLATTTLELTGLKNPTEIQVFDAGTATLIASQENVTAGTFSTQIDAGTYPDVDISIISLGYQNTRLLGISTVSDISIPVQQVIDRQYLNP